LQLSQSLDACPKFYRLVWQIPLLKIHKVLGFKIEGTFKKHVKVKNKYEDIIFTSLFKKDWNMSKKKILSNFRY
jgi:hypothetical protein